MKKSLVLLIFLLVISFSPPKKAFYPYAIAITESELIIDGTISNVNSDEYEIEVCEFVKGISKDRINVKIWEEWECDNRVGEIKNGQRLILFLNKDNNGNCHSVFNGSTGELFVSPDGSVKTFMTKFSPKVEELKNGIQMFQNAFKFKGDLTKYFEKDRHFERLISQEKIDLMKLENEFFQFIIDEELKYYEVK